MSELYDSLNDSLERERLLREQEGLYATAFCMAREQLLHMVGPLEVNEILTTLDEACEAASMKPSLVDALDQRVAELEATNESLRLLLEESTKTLAIANKAAGFTRG
jgi:hypothetical protein